MIRALLAGIALFQPLLAAEAAVKNGQPVRPVTTYSIVARDQATGQLGVAVQSHWFSVGSVVPWVEAGVGAVATQSLTEVSYGPLGIELMRSGKTSEQALKGLLAADKNPEWRQVGMIDAAGRSAVHTGGSCIPKAGHAVGDNYIVMANLMEKETVWGAMAMAFEQARGDLADRMLAALEAAQGEGGDIRGRQSAAMVVVKAQSTGAPYRDRLVDLRVDDHPEPLKELRRLVRINRAYQYMNEGDEKMADNDMKGALKAYEAAMKHAPEITEIQFWVAVTLFTEGHESRALNYFKQAFEKEERWREVVRRLPAAGLLKNDAGQVDRILKAGF